MPEMPERNEEEDAVRFEDLTVDDDLPIIERMVRYTNSQIALQRLVHVKMLAETAELSGCVPKHGWGWFGEEEEEEPR